MADPISILDRREHVPPFLSSVKSEWARWAVSIILAAVVAWATANKHIESRLSVLEATESAHFEEIQRSLLRIETWMLRQEKR